MNEKLASDSVSAFSDPERRAIQSLVASLHRIEKDISASEQSKALRLLLERAELNGLQGIIKKVGIQQTDTLDETIGKLTRVLGREREENFEKDVIQEELALLESFAKAKAAEQEDILHTSNRIAEYERELETLAEAGQSSLWQRLFSKDGDGGNFDPNQEKKEELENKIMRAQTELAGRIQKTENQTLHFQDLLQSWQRELGEPEEEGASWQELVVKVRAAAERLANKDKNEKRPLQQENLVL